MLLILLPQTIRKHIKQIPTWICFACFTTINYIRKKLDVLSLNLSQEKKLVEKLFSF